MFDIEVINSGSDGNAVMIDDCILIDFGLAYKHVGKYMNKADVIIVTHRHGDHFHLQAFKMFLKKNSFKVRNVMYMNKDVANHIDEKLENSDLSFVPKRENILKTNTFQDSTLEVYELNTKKGKYKMEIFRLVHDVENQGIILTNENGETLIYATDTETMEYAPKGRKYDYILVEGNYDEQKVLEAMKSLDLERVRRSQFNERHLSLSEFENFVKKHSKPNTKVWQLHISSEFGTLSKLIDTEDY